MRIGIMIVVGAGTYFTPWCVIPYLGYLAYEYFTRLPIKDRNLEARIERLEIERSL